MASNAIVDTGFLVALLSRRDANHQWAVAAAPMQPPPWHTCEAVLSESSHLIGPHGADRLSALFRRGAVVCSFRFADDAEAVLKLMDKYADVPIGFADACLIRMTEKVSEPVVLTTDTDFRIYRRHGRQTIPCIVPR